MNIQSWLPLESTGLIFLLSKELSRVFSSTTFQKHHLVPSILYIPAHTSVPDHRKDSKITVDGDRSHEIKRCLLLGRKAMTNLDSILKSRDITLPTKVHIVKGMFFPVLIKKAESWRIDAFELWCWRRLSRVTWTARRSNQSILKEISPGCSLEGLMKLKLQYFGHLMWWDDSLERTLMLGGIGGRRRRGWQRMRWLDGITDSMDMSFGRLGIGDGQGGLACWDSWGCKESDMTERPNWTELNWQKILRRLIF